jgi:signal peptidase I
MTSFDEMSGTPHVPVVERAHRSSFGWVVLDWLRSFGAAAAQVVLTVAVLLGLLATAPVAFGQISTTVMSDSMEPGLRSGDVVILRPVTSNHVRLGQVVLVDDPDYPGRLRLHRLLDVRHGDLVLKGDANATPDSSYVSAKRLHGVGWLRVPWIGLPVLWMRDHDYLPLALAALALVLLSWLAAADSQDDGRQRDEPTLAQRGARRLLQRSRRLLRRSRAAQSAGASLLMASLLVAAPLAQPGSAAAFNSTTTSPSNSIGTGTFNCPTRPFSGASSVLYYSYMPASGTAEPDVSGASTAQPGTLAAGASRIVGNCSGNASPSVSLNGTTNGFVASNNQVTPNVEFTVTFWFMTATNSGVLASFGTTKTVAPTGSGDRQVYFKGNQLSFAMQGLSNQVSSCSIGTAPTTNQWHLAVASFAQSGQMTLWLDNASTSCSTTDSNISLTPGYWRFGADTPLAPGVSNNYGGQLDETAVYSGPVSAAQISTISGAGH